MVIPKETEDSAAFRAKEVRRGTAKEKRSIEGKRQSKYSIEQSYLNEHSGN